MLTYIRNRIAEGRANWRSDSRLMRECRPFNIWTDHVDHTFRNVTLDGLFCEFGIYMGATLSYFCQASKWHFHGFDSFEGLQEKWKEHGVGHLSLGGEIPDYKNFPRDRVTIHKGYFEDTLPPFLATHPGPAAFLHVDCDLYSSTKTIFRLMRDRIVPGTVMMFDEYITLGEKDERLALQESGLRFRYLSRNVHSGGAGESVAVVIAA